MRTDFIMTVLALATRQASATEQRLLATVGPRAGPLDGVQEAVPCSRSHVACSHKQS